MLTISEANRRDLEGLLASSSQRALEIDEQLAQVAAQWQELEALLDGSKARWAQASARLNELEGELEISDGRLAEGKTQRRELLAILERSEAQRQDTEDRRSNTLARMSGVEQRLELCNARCAKAETRLEEAMAGRHEAGALGESESWTTPALASAGLRSEKRTKAAVAEPMKRESPMTPREWSHRQRWRKAMRPSL